MTPLDRQNNHTDMNHEDTAYIVNLGKPFDTDDANMVDEGAMTSIQYYNRLVEEGFEREAEQHHH